jgi:beta-glucanase (GH16 family)
VSNGTCKIVTNKVDYNGRVSNWPECNPDKPGYSVNNKKCMDECKTGGDGISRCWTIDTLPFKYTTGMLYSKQKFFRGYFEIRFRLPAPPEPPGNHQGFGPNFWLYGNNRPVNYTSEIDIFEIIALHPPKGDTNKYTSTVHYSDKQSNTHPTAHTEALGNRLKDDTDWHTAAVWWTDKFVKFYFDGSPYYTVENRKDIPVDKLAEMYMIIDVNAPTWGRCNNFDPELTRFPYVYEIDYVRVYQQQ